MMNYDSFYSTPTTQLYSTKCPPCPSLMLFCLSHVCNSLYVQCLPSECSLRPVCSLWMSAVNGMLCLVCSLVLHEIRSLWWSVPLVKCLSCWCWLPPAGVLSCSVPHGVYAYWLNWNRSAVSDSSKSYICDFIDSYSLPMSTIDVQSLDAWLTKPKPLSGFSFVSFVFFHGTM